MCCFSSPNDKCYLKYIANSPQYWLRNAFCSLWITTKHIKVQLKKSKEFPVEQTEGLRNPPESHQNPTVSRLASVPFQARGAQTVPRSKGSQITWQRSRVVVSLSALRTGRLYPQEMLLVFISFRGWVDPRDIVRTEGFYVNEKFQWHHLGSNQRPSDL